MIIFFWWLLVTSLVSIFVYGFIGIGAIFENLKKELKEDDR